MMTRAQIVADSISASIAIATIKERTQCLEALLSSLVKTNIQQKKCEVIIVCDGKSRKNEEIVNKFQRNTGWNVKYIENPERVGIARAKNIAVMNCEKDIVIFLDDDVIVHPDYIKYILDDFLQNPQVSLVVGMVFGERFTSGIPVSSLKETNKIQEVWNRIESKKIEGNFSGANMAIRRELLQRYGAFDERLGTYSLYEDNDLLLRAGKLGKVMRDSRAKVMHLKAKHRNIGRWTSTLSLKDKIHVTTRNTVYVYLKNGRSPIFKLLKRLIKKFAHTCSKHRTMSSFMEILEAMAFGVLIGFVDGCILAKHKKVAH